MARSKRKNKSGCSLHRKKRHCSLNNPLSSSDKTGGTVSSAGIEESSAAFDDASGHLAGNPKDNVETLKTGQKMGAVRGRWNSVEMYGSLKGNVGTVGNPILTSPEKIEKDGANKPASQSKEDKEEKSKKIF
eukprot:7526821-Ditylum_brightwellii.AAC.1